MPADFRWRGPSRVRVGPETLRLGDRHLPRGGRSLRRHDHGGATRVPGNGCPRVSPRGATPRCAERFLTLSNDVTIQTAARVLIIATLVRTLDSTPALIFGGERSDR